MSTELPFGRQPAMEHFLEFCHKRTFPAKFTIINAGDHSSELYYLIKGSVSVLIEDDDGHEIILAYLNEGDFFGEIGMLDEKHERSAWVRARTPCEVAQISYEKLKNLSPQLPEVLYALLSQMALRLRNTSRKVGDLAFMDVIGPRCTHPTGPVQAARCHDASGWHADSHHPPGARPHCRVLSGNGRSGAEESRGRKPHHRGWQNHRRVRRTPNDFRRSSTQPAHDGARRTPTMIQPRNPDTAVAEINQLLEGGRHREAAAAMPLARRRVSPTTQAC